MTATLRRVAGAIEALAGDFEENGELDAAAVTRQTLSVLLARAGLAGEAFAALGTRDGPPTRWDRALVHAAIIARLHRLGLAADRDEALEHSVREAAATTLFERGAHASFTDLAQALADQGAGDVLPRLADVGGPGGRDAACAALARAALVRGDLATAASTALSISSADIRANALIDVIQHAEETGRADDVRALAPELANTGYEHQAAAALAGTGDTDRALAFAGRATAGWNRAFALAAIAAAIGRSGDVVAFGEAAACAIAACDDPVLWWQGHELLVAGARAALGTTGALAWIAGTPAVHRDGLFVELAQALAADGEAAAARTALSRVEDDEEREDATARVEDDIAARAAALGPTPRARFHTLLDAAHGTASDAATDFLKDAIALVPEVAWDDVAEAFECGAALGASIATIPASDRADLTAELWIRYAEADGVIRGIVLTAVAEVELRSS